MTTAKQSIPRKGSFVLEKHKESLLFLEEATFRNQTSEFDNTPFEDCIAILEKNVSLKNLRVKKGVLLFKGAKSNPEAYDKVHWSGWAHEASQHPTLADNGLIFVPVYNRYEYGEFDSNEEGNYYNTIDGELLLASLENPERNIVLSASGQTHVHVGSVGQTWNSTDKKVIMNLNGKPFWKDFDLDTPSTKKSVETFQKLIASTFPGVSMSQEDAEELLETIGGYFSANERPRC